VFIKTDRLVDPQRLNLYSYVRSNPLRYVDPDGADLTVVVSGVAVGRSYVNHRPGGGGPREAVSTYRVTLFNGSGSFESTAVTRDTNYNGPTSETRDNYGTASETPPGDYAGRIRTEGSLGYRIQLYDPEVDNGSKTQIEAPDGTMRDGIAIHIGPGCSEGCMLLQGGPQGRSAFRSTVEKMLGEDRANKKGTAIHVIIAPRNKSQIDDGAPRDETLDEIRKREQMERKP
jgi:hypothetical protein